jgi:hypothetical protein
MSTRLLMALFLALTGASGVCAQTGDTDWQMYGAADFGKMGGKQRQFFDAAGVIRRNNGHVEVWTKSLSEKDMDRVQRDGSDLQTKIVARAAYQKLHGYRPPLSVALKRDDDGTVVQIIMDEATANMSAVEPTVRILYDVDCPNRLFRALSMQLTVNGNPQDKETPSEWKHVAPETSVANLLKLLCAQHQDKQAAAP